MNQSMIDKPNIIIVVEKIVKRNTPIIVAKALSRYLADKFDNKITNEIRSEHGFDESSHRRLFHKNQALNKCRCVHCIARQEYVDKKLTKHRVKRNLYSDIPFTDGEYERIMNSLKLLDSQIDRRKQDILSYVRRLEI